jgi:hypothetical protein
VENCRWGLLCTYVLESCLSTLGPLCEFTLLLTCHLHGSLQHQLHCLQPPVVRSPGADWCKIGPLGQFYIVWTHQEKKIRLSEEDSRFFCWVKSAVSTDLIFFCWVKPAVSTEFVCRFTRFIRTVLRLSQLNWDSLNQFELGWCQYKDKSSGKILVNTFSSSQFEFPGWVRCLEPWLYSYSGKFCPLSNYFFFIIFFTELNY